MDKNKGNKRNKNSSHNPFKKRGKKALMLVSLCILTTPLTACFDKTKEIQQEKVTAYNETVTNTLNAYTGVKAFIRENQINLENYLIFDSQFKLAENAKYNTVPPLDEEEIENFNAYNSVMSNDYFTSLGANTIRQVLIVKGQKQLMYSTILWSDKEIISIERVIKHE